MTRISTGRTSLAAALALSAFACLSQSAPASAGEIQRYMVDCGGKMCPWFEAVVTPPKGWVISKNETHINRVTLMFPGAKVDYSGAVMYVKTSFDGDNQPLADFIATAQKRWKASHADFTAEKQADVKRGGKPDGTVFLYKNPSMPQQAFELTAFVKDVDPAHKDQNFVFQVVLTAPSMQGIDANKAAFYEMLRGL
jgi:hypothetical protein